MQALFNSLFLLLIFIILLADAQTYYQPKQIRHYPAQNDQQYHQKLRQGYPQTQKPSNHNYYRTDVSSGHFNISAINYSNKFQSPPALATPTSPSRQHYVTPHQSALQNTYYRSPQNIHSSPSYSACNVPSDFWCDSYEIAQRCGVTQQCDHLKRLTSPITVTLMFEALCPFCQRFISNHLGNLFDQFRSKVEIELVPWGNSRLLPNGQISCNHGQAECDANRLISCVIDMVKTKQAIPFIVCFERQLSTYPQVEQALHHCSTFVRNDYREIRQCYESERGRQLQRQAAYRTMNIRAHPIIEVPYIVINNYSPSTDANGLNIMSLQQLLNKWLNLRQK